MKSLFLSAAALALSAGMAFAENPMVGGAAMFDTKNIIENAVNSADHTTLVAAVTAAGLVETLSGAGPFTVLAPTNDAFAKLPAGTVESLLKPENKEKLAGILAYHVVPGNIKAADMQSNMVKTANGANLDIKATEASVTVNGAKVVKADVMASNGVIHVNDTVLMPPAK